MAKQLLVESITSEGNKAESGETAQLWLSVIWNKCAVKAGSGVAAAHG